MGFIDKVYWVTDENGKQHLMNVKERLVPITQKEKEHDIKLRRAFDRIVERNGDALRSLAESDYKPFPSDYAYWAEQAKQAYARGKIDGIYQLNDDN